MNARPAHDFATPHDAERGRFRFDLVASEPGDSHLFWWAFDRAADEDLSAARVDRVFADFAARHAKDARFETGDALVDGWLGYVAPQSAAYEVDGLGAFRASPTYWGWGWDAMVQAARDRPMMRTTSVCSSMKGSSFHAEALACVAAAVAWGNEIWYHSSRNVEKGIRERGAQGLRTARQKPRGRVRARFQYPPRLLAKPQEAI